MKGTILVVDLDPGRADVICDLLIMNEIPASRCRTLDDTIRAIDSENLPAVIVAHCSLINRSFTELADLRNHPHVRLLFYCTDKTQRSGRIVKLPEELDEMILRITEISKNLAPAC